MPIIESILTGMAANGAYELSKDAVTRAISLIRSSNPALITKADDAAAKGDDAGVRAALSDALSVLAASGEIKIDGAAISAVKLAKFDHQAGTITIGRTSISAPVLTTGGSARSTGKTVIDGGTTLASQGTRIDVGHGASIVMTGGASIKQT